MSCSTEASLEIVVGARPSPLSRVQVDEVLDALRQHHPAVRFAPLWLSSPGDRDQATSLRGMDKTDFFTRDIDEALLLGRCRIAIHSAKDLPAPLPHGIAIAAITKGLDSHDSLVLPQGTTLATLPPSPLIATSSARREAAVCALLPTARFCDLRGVIGQRLALLDSGAIDGVVIAEAALLRLAHHRRNRLPLPGPAAPLQGQLAVLIRAADAPMAALFRPLDCGDRP